MPIHLPWLILGAQRIVKEGEKDYLQKDCIASGIFFYNILFSDSVD
jgi:hypothetical protein